MLFDAYLVCCVSGFNVVQLSLPWLLVVKTYYNTARAVYLEVSSFTLTQTLFGVSILYWFHNDACYKSRFIGTIKGNLTRGVDVINNYVH